MRKSESRVNPGASIGREDCWGTCDIILLDDSGLEIIDFKYGKGVQVEPDDPQLKLYAIGAMYGLDRPLESGFPVLLTIVQPRGFHPRGPIRSHATTKGELWEWRNDFLTAAQKTDHPNAPAIPSVDGCRFCRAAPLCPEYRDAALKAVSAGLQPIEVGDTAAMEAAVPRDPESLTQQQQKFILDNEALIQGFLKAVRLAAERQARNGGFPGYKFVEGRSSQKWQEELQRRDFSGNAWELLHPTSLLSPAQTRKQWKKFNPDERSVLDAAIIKQPGNPTLVPESDPRPAIDRAAACFQPIEE